MASGWPTSADRAAAYLALVDEAAWFRREAVCMTTRFRRLGLGVVDQGLSSLSNVLFLVAAARTSTVEEFGAVSFAYALFAFGMAVQRSSLGLLVSLSSGSRQVPPRLSVLWAMLIAGLGVVLGRTIGDGGTAAYYVLVGACLLVYPQDLLRYGALAERRADRAAASDGAWFVITLALLLLDPRRARRGRHLDVLTWVLAGGGIALLVMLVPQRGDVRTDSGGWFRQHARELRVLGPDALLASLAPLVLAAVMTSFMTFGDVAAVRGAGTLLGLRRSSSQPCQRSRCLSSSASWVKTGHGSPPRRPQ